MAILVRNSLREPGWTCAAPASFPLLKVTYLVPKLDKRSKRKLLISTVHSRTLGQVICEVLWFWVTDTHWWWNESCPELLCKHRECV